ncbi:VanW family protein [Nocardioides sp.]|uniref:VanW family protein n=1 Tax=Nocardioides sp. TaxID=35761 RepID=UPI002B275C3F|nr:VanW family protein [Nocardioides sp.]
MSTKSRPSAAPREPREHAGGRVVVVLVLVLGLLVAGGYAAAYAAAGDNVPRGTRVAGVDIGGRSSAGAVKLLVDELGPSVRAPIEVVVDDTVLSIDPRTSGLGVDFQATVRQAGGGRSWAPERLWNYYTGGDDLEPVVMVDDDTLEAAIDEAAEEVGTPARDGRIRFVDGRVVVRDPKVGAGLDTAAVAESVREAYLSGDAVTASLVDLAPEIGDDEVTAALDGFANPAISGPVTMKFGASRVSLSPRDYADALSLDAVDGELVPAVDEDVIVALVEDATVGKGAPVDATVALVDGKPQVVRSKPGLIFEPEDVVEAFLDLVAQPEGERVAEVEGTVQPAEFTTRDARKLKIKEEVSDFSTFFPYAEYRNVNLGRAAEIINGTVLKPGEIFSMNDIVGERTRENGFTEGFIISNGIFKEDLGGGVSQMATTLFNAMFFAGLKDIEHKPHSFYIDRYPIGREATVVFGALDLRFQNDTEYGVLVTADVTPSTPSSQGELRVRMFSTKVWDIESITGGRYNPTSPETRTLTTEDCYPNTGYDGFTIDVTRVFRNVGEDEVVRREVFNTVYTPSDTVICKDPEPKKSGNG